MKYITPILLILSCGLYAADIKEEEFIQIIDKNIDYVRELKEHAHEQGNMLEYAWEDGHEMGLLHARYLFRIYCQDPKKPCIIDYDLE